jgi:hypothetical protein
MAQVELQLKWSAQLDLKWSAMTSFNFNILKLAINMRY